ncbi:MAG: GAF domain-containing protein [Verrucomicrobiota bacterium]|nr:GAF domain-containing protein [Verrucomicrobiota bacterium]
MTPPTETSNRASLRIVGIYTVFSLAYIWCSDWIVLQLVREPRLLTEVQNYKGWAFVLFSAGLLFVLIRRAQSKQEQVEQTIRQERDFSNAVLDSLPGVFYCFDAQLRFRRWNKNFERVTGYAKGEIATKSPLDFFAGPDRELLRARIQQVFVAGRAEAEAEMIAKDGARTPYYFTGVVTQIDGRPCLVGVGIDIAERKRAEDKIQRLNRLYAFSSSVNEVIVRVRDMQELYDMACRIAVEQCGFLMAWMGLVESGDDALKPVARAGQGADYLTTIRVSVQPQPAGIGPSGRAYREGRVVFSNNIEADSDLQPWRDEALKRGYRSSAAFPIGVAGATIGVFSVYAGQVGFFEVEELRLLKTLAENISFAAESHQNEQSRAQAESGLRESHQQMRALTARLESLREEERIRISREIHDELGQNLTGLKMDLHWLENRLALVGDEKLRTAMAGKLSTASRTADETMASVQRIAAELRPDMLDSLGLIATLRYEAKQFETRTGVAVALNFPAVTDQLDNAVSTTAYRIFKEMLTNVARHAQATKVQASLEIAAGKLSLQVEDNGVGVSPEDLLSPKSLGLLGMNERAAMLNGTVRVVGVPGQGTIVRLEISVEKPAAGGKESKP